MNSKLQVKYNFQYYMQTKSARLCKLYKNKSTLNRKLQCVYYYHNNTLLIIA